MNWRRLLGLPDSKGFVRDFMEKAHREGAGNAFAPDLNRLLSSCPLCHSPLTGHDYSLLTSRSACGPGTPENARALLALLHNEDWVACEAQLEDTLQSDSLDVFVIRCPRSGALWLLRSRPYDYLLPSVILAVSPMTEEGLRRLTDPATSLHLTWYPL